MTDPTAPMADRPRPRPRGLLFPVLLIALGSAFLLGNLGLIPPFSARALFSLWPLILIVIGIEIAFGRREPFLALALEIAAVVVGVALVAAQPRGLFLQPGATSSNVSVPREDARSLSLRVSGGAGTYVVSGGAGALVEARSEGTELRVRTDRRAGTADVRVDPSGPFDIFRFGGGPPMDVRVRVANDVPASIRLDGGAGDFTLDMRELSVTEARIETGASNVLVVLPVPRGEVLVRIEAGAASIEIQVPEGVEARISTTGGALSLSLQNPRFDAGTSGAVAAVGRGNETAGYATAKDRVSVTIEAGATSITVR